MNSVRRNSSVADRERSLPGAAALSPQNGSGRFRAKAAKVAKENDLSLRFSSRPARGPRPHFKPYHCPQMPRVAADWAARRAEMASVLAKTDLPLTKGEFPFSKGSLPRTKGHRPFSKGDLPFAKGDLPFLNGHSPSAKGKRPFTKGAATCARAESCSRRRRPSAGRPKASCADLNFLIHPFETN
jgi:hypothetical protein